MTSRNNDNPQPAATPESLAPQKQFSPLAKWAFYCLLIGLILGVASIFGLSMSGQSVFFLLMGYGGVILWLAALVLVRNVLSLVERRRHHHEGLGVRHHGHGADHLRAGTDLADTGTGGGNGLAQICGLGFSPTGVDGTDRPDARWLI